MAAESVEVDGVEVSGTFDLLLPLRASFSCLCCWSLFVSFLFVFFVDFAVLKAKNTPKKRKRWEIRFHLTPFKKCGQILRANLVLLLRGANLS